MLTNGTFDQASIIGKEISAILNKLKQNTKKK